ncbi:hypothetical protein LTR70_003684 [Exophiala xenobiotica]|uniref:HECT-type E3 ubiquitin transferase n=1 Tax=Lithohypha guttulata TaxID=1690604 RepID=A0ABR0KI72_9EURO|nr:hypothetical protein LTR24_002355 [Lithohypha guttulata]KAK5322736.1 hypothetical protein LTR70_003684 [Exophiala xenobiotica]
MRPTTITFDGANPRNFDAERDVPNSLRQYLTTAESTRDIYLDRVHASERRLRLLHRRFLNQITYGCRNPYCNVPTCFSYRKRVSGSAIRPYTDVSARALAAKCVEQYASHGRDLGRSPKREHGKSKAILGGAVGHVHDDGLCRNEPVIPWYANPDEYLPKLRTAAAKDGRSRGHSPSRRQTAMQGKPGGNSNGYVALPTTPKSNGTQLDKTSGSEGEYVCQQGTSTDMVVKPEGESSFQRTIPLTPDNETAHLPDAASGVHVARSPSIRKDHASFVQSLFSKPELQALNRPPDEKSAATAHQAGAPIIDGYGIKASEEQPSSSSRPHCQPSKPAGHDRTEEQLLGSSTGGRSQQIDPKTMRPAYTFKLLPASAILWLRNMLIMHAGHTEQEAPESPTPTAFDQFVEQSLYFVFSDARRLMSSASTWDDYVSFRNTQDATGGHPTAGLTTAQYLPKNDSVIKAREAATGHQLTADNITGTFGMTHAKWSSVLKVSMDLAQLVPGGQGQLRLMRHMLQAIEQGFGVQSWMKQLKMTTPIAQEGMSPLTNHELAHLITLVLSVATTKLYTMADVISTDNKASTLGPLEGLTALEYHLTAEPPRRFPSSFLFNANPPRFSPGGLPRYPTTNYWPYDHDFSRLFTAIANLISFRIGLDAARKAQKVKPRNSVPDTDIVKAICKFLQNPEIDHPDPCIQLLQFMLAVLYLKWDRRPVVQRAGPVGGALEMLKGLYQAREELDIGDSEFQLDVLFDAFDEFEMPYEWLSFKPDAIHMHILQFAFLFPPVILVRFFRSLNFRIMKLSHEKAMEEFTNARSQMMHARWPPPRGMDEVLEKARPHMALYFVMTIRREHILEDAVGQIWRRERQELMRPLRVRLGEDDGEEGLDHGGVQQEFFRLVFSEALDARYGMFTTDDTTRMTWFQPGSLEPLYKYEALGILMSLAVFNGVTIPITMPLAFYRKILGLKVKKIEHIQDGWPEIANSFEQLLDWNDGDVGDVIGRTYEFTYEVYGSRVSIDMSRKSPERRHEDTEVRPSMILSEPHEKTANLINGVKYLGKFASLEINETADASDCSSTNNSISSDTAQEPPLVDNDNREDYVKDYIRHLTDITVAPQFTAFLRGLHTLLSPRSLALFSPQVLKELIEGLPTTQPLNIDDWKATTELDGFLPTDPLITWYWDILANDFNQSQLRALLAFVTASDRIPVGGWDGVIFIIQRNGDDEDMVRLPTSQTCYGRLLLPEYSSREVLKRQLEWAVDNSWGFWMA